MGLGRTLCAAGSLRFVVREPVHDVRARGVRCGETFAPGRACCVCVVTLPHGRHGTALHSQALLLQL
jgi:hypothetical protein